MAGTSQLRRRLFPSREESVGAHVLPNFAELPLAAIGQLEVRAWVAELTAQGLAPATVAKAYQVLGKTLRAAVDAGLIARTPCRNIPLPKVEREEMRFLTPAEVNLLADTIHPRYRALVLLGAYGGLRIGEMAGLRPERVDLLRGQVEVVEVQTEVRGRLVSGPPKTKAGRRAVVQELERHLAQWSSLEYVFTAPEGGPLRIPSFRQRSWRPAVNTAGLEPLRVHDLRHTAVSFWIAAGANPKEVAARAGHTSVRTVFDVYGHLLPRNDDSLTAKLDQMFAAGSAEALRGRIIPLKR